MPEDDCPFQLGVVILAAGASTRMGSPKMLLPWGSTTVIGHLIGVWSAALGAEQVAIVCAPSPAPTLAELCRLEFPAQNIITNPTPGRGMFSSIQTAALWNGWASGLTHIGLVLGDQPHLALKTLGYLIDAARRNPATIHQLSHHQKPRHPIFFPIEVFRNLAGSRSPTLRDFLADKEKCLVEVDDRGLDLDLDYPSDYDAARAIAEVNMAPILKEP